MDSTITSDIETLREGSTYLIKFARPAKRNALTVAMYERMNAALEEAAADASVRAVVFASTSDVFTAGNDLGDFMEHPPTGDDSPVFRFIRGLASFEKPLIAAVDGKAIGLGLTMLLHCDFVYVSERTTLLAPFVNLGLVPEAASSLLLPKLVGHVRASALLLLGEPIDGTTAVALGLANAVLPPDQVLLKALETATKLANKSPSALRETKRLLRDPTVVHARMKEEGDLFLKQLASPEVAEAIGAFFEKRTPDFSKL